MRKKIIISGVAALALIFAGQALAASTNKGSADSGPVEQAAQTGMQDQAAQAGQQVETANQGEDSQMQAENQVQVQADAESDASATAGGVGTQLREQEELTDESGAARQAGQLSQNQAKGQNQANGRALERRSRVANAVQEMLQVAERNQGIGQQIRTIAQAQNQEQEQIEAEMAQVKNRGQIRKFFFGPDYKSLNTVADRLAKHAEKIAQLKALLPQINDADDIANLQEQIAVMEGITAEIQNEADSASKGFSLFGWLNKMFSK